MLFNLLNFLFGCKHEHTSRVFTIKQENRSYITCLCCGAEFDYSWDKMQITRKSFRLKPTHRDFVPELKR